MQIRTLSYVALSEVLGPQADPNYLGNCDPPFTWGDCEHSLVAASRLVEFFQEEGEPGHAEIAARLIALQETLVDLEE